MSKTDARLLAVIGILMAFTFGALFRTGCSPDANAAPVPFSETYSFTIIDDIVVTNISPTPNSNLQATNSKIIFDVTHSLPIENVSIAVKVNNVLVSGDLVTTAITGGKHAVWTPEEEYPTLATIAWSIFVVVENGL